MSSNYREFISLGANHHMLHKFPKSDKLHCETMLPFLDDQRFDVFDGFILDEEPYRSQEVAAVKASGRPFITNIGDKAGKPKLYPTAIDKDIRKYTIDHYKHELEKAILVDSKKVVTGSGPQHPKDYDVAFDALVDFYCTLCDFVPNDVMILLEHTDTNIDKCFFMGSSRETARVCDAVHAAGFTNFGSMIDMCHLPLINETVTQAFNDLGKYMNHIHFGTCVIGDKTNKYYGDRHPAWGFPGTTWAEKEIAELITLCLKSGYFSRENRGTATFEMVAYDDTNPLKSHDIFIEYIERAWGLVDDELKK